VVPKKPDPPLMETVNPLLWPMKAQCANRWQCNSLCRARHR
jgi:hypothetical protein